MNSRRLWSLSLIVCAMLTLGLAASAGALGFPATGQTTAYTAEKKDGINGPVAVPGDGTVRAGAVLSYTDNGDGTITDNNTGLMWEKKGDNGGLHDKDNGYYWSGMGAQETLWDWLDDVNAEGGTGFAGYNDWRIPNAKELPDARAFPEQRADDLGRVQQQLRGGCHRPDRQLYGREQLLVLDDLGPEHGHGVGCDLLRSPPASV